MSQQDDYVAEINGKVPKAVPDTDRILFECYSDSLSVEQALVKLHERGAKDWDAEKVARHYDDIISLVNQWHGPN